MILNYSSIMLPLKINPPAKTTLINKKSRPITLACFSTTINSSSNNNNIKSSSNQVKRIDTELLRTQLDQLHAEFDATQSKANNARMRLMRLSEAAESLQKRAASSILVGKETEARELLLQKKKLMQALEKSKNRVDVYDKLAMKINEAISLKEAQLIGNVSMYPEFAEEETDHQIRFVEPKVDDDDGDSSKITNAFDSDCINMDQDDDHEAEEFEDNFLEASSIDTSNYGMLTSILNEISSYEDFLQHIDGKLQHMESELDMVLRLSTMILNSEEKNTSTKVQQTSGILKDIRSIRERIANILNKQMKEEAS